MTTEDERIAIAEEKHQKQMAKLQARFEKLKSKAEKRLGKKETARIIREANEEK